MKHEKRQEIIDTAIDLFAEHGISNVSIVMIAKHLGVSRSTVYHHFKRGKKAIISEILRSYEDCISKNVPSENDWKSKDANIDEVLSSLFFEFPAADALRLRKIVRIVMSEMYFNAQIAQHVRNYLITGREKMLAGCFTSLYDDSKILPLDADSVARCLNRVVLSYAIEDALRYPFINDEAELHEQSMRMIRDCTNIIHYMIKKSSSPPANKSILSDI